MHRVRAENILPALYKTSIKERETYLLFSACPKRSGEIKVGAWYNKLVYSAEIGLFIQSYCMSNVKAHLRRSRRTLHRVALASLGQYHCPGRHCSGEHPSSLHPTMKHRTGRHSPCEHSLG